jgi:DNA replicative helicase MCM subunit Mcm2 (Cdc46/Mcm family)
MPDIIKATKRVYKCKRCGHVSVQTTNHRGDTWSWEHVNTCPKCPPFAKYPEFGGRTVWEYVKDVEE